MFRARRLLLLVMGLRLLVVLVLVLGFHLLQQQPQQLQPPLLFCRSLWSSSLLRLQLLRQTGVAGVRVVVGISWTTGAV